MSLTEFLLARIGEDAADGCPCRFVDEDRDVCDTRWAADCEAKRLTVDLAAFLLEAWEEKPGGAYPDMGRRERHFAQTILTNLALPYADHPEYREEWKP